MIDVIMDFETLSRETRSLINSFLENQDKATSWIHEYVEHAKDVMNQNSFLHSNAIAETPKRASRGSLPKPVRVLSNSGGITIVLTPPPVTPKRSKGWSTRSRGLKSCDNDVNSCHSEKENDVETPMEQQLPEQNDDYLCVEEIENKCDKTYFLSPVTPMPKGTPDIKKGSAKKSVRSARSNQPGSSHKVLASTKSSRHRNSLNRSQVSSCSKPVVAKQRVLRQTRERQEHEEALAKKQALLKIRVEVQKRKREMKMEKNLRARQKIEQQTEERLKKMSMLHRKESVANNAKDTDKRRNTQKNKKRKQTESSDSEKPNAVPATKVIKILPNKPIAPVAPVARINPASTKKPSINPGILKTDTGSSEKINLASVKKIDPVKNAAVTITSLSTGKNVSGSHSKTPSMESVTPQKPTADQKALNSTYVAEDKENSESYTMTPCPQEMSYTNYDMSDLRPSDDDDDDVDSSKPMPSWALGIRLKEALIKQYFHPPNIDKLFPSIEIAEDEAFGMRYKKVHRTSSAVWNSTPLRNY